MKRGAAWPIGITAILATTVAANIWVMRIANDDPSFAIEQDYYKNAVAWDTTAAQARESAKLGWVLTPTLDVGLSGQLRLVVRLTDSTGSAIPDAAIRVRALYVGRASTVYELTLVSVAASEYAAEIPADHAGQWELRIDVQAGAKRLTQVARVEAAAAR